MSPYNPLITAIRDSTVASWFTDKLSDPTLIIGQPHLLLILTVCWIVNVVLLTMPVEEQKFQPYVMSFRLVSFTLVLTGFRPRHAVSCFTRMLLLIQNKIYQMPDLVKPSKKETKLAVSEISLPSLETKQTEMIVASSYGSLETIEQIVKAALLNPNQVVGETQTLELKIPFNFFGKSFIITNPNHQQRDHLKKSHNSVLTEFKDGEYLRKMLSATIIPRQIQNCEFSQYDFTVILGPEAERIGGGIPMLEMQLKTIFPSPPDHQFNQTLLLFIIASIYLRKFYYYASPLLWDPLLKMVPSSRSPRWGAYVRAWLPAGKIESQSLARLKLVDMEIEGQEGNNRNENTSTSFLLRKIRYHSKPVVEKGEYSEPQDPSDLEISRSNPKRSQAESSRTGEKGIAIDKQDTRLQLKMKEKMF